MSTPGATAPGPRFTIISAVYNVARYLDEFIKSVEAQTFSLKDVEVIMVNDGSTDDSLSILEGWQRRRPELVRIVTKPNGGLPSARNAGMEFIRGEWVTFTDPDDILDRRFLEVVDTFLRERPETMMVATNRIVFSDTTGEVTKHALHRHFTKNANRLRNLDYDTGHFHGHAASTFFRADVIKREHLLFDERLRATFEDGHFCNIYLLRVDEPLVAYLPFALYNYRRRDDGTSQLDRSWANPGRFIDVLEHGYLDLLREGVRIRGRAPSWLQGMVIYELSWYFKTNDKMAAPTAAVGETAQRFHELLGQICALLDETGIETYSATTFNAAWREILRHGYTGQRWHTPFAIVDKMDARQQLMRVTYRFTGEQPEERFVVFGKPVEPVHQKIRDITFFERTVMLERIVWLPFGTLRVLLDGRDLDMRTSEPAPATHRLNRLVIQKKYDPASLPPAERSRRKRTLSDRMIARLARTRAVRWYFGNAWVLIDRIFNADDSAEHLFRYLRTHRRRVKAWFVIQRGTPDYDRLCRDGYQRRVVGYGTLMWKLLMLNCEHLISSHIDEVIMRPAEVLRLGKPRWRLTFLQHGVMKDDLSSWLNRKNIDIFVTSTQAEYDSVVADHTTYRYTTRETRLTGLPRFDRILEEGNRIPPERRDLILVAPTWREWLSIPQQEGVGKHIVRPDFLESDYAKEWTALLNSPELRELAERTGLTVGLLMHPNFQATARLDLQPHVELFEFEGQNVQELFARSRVLITDYSSMFFNAAYIERPVVYFQFDRERVLAGWHLGRRGYFDYERDGYGPVTLTCDDAVGAISKAVENGPAPEPLYLQRIRESFPNRDGRCCERVADAIENSTKPLTPVPHRSLARRVAGRARREARSALIRVQQRLKAS